TADLAERDLHAALVANHSAVLHALVLTAQTLPVGDGAKNLRAKQPVTLGLKRAVVDGLGLGDFAVGPRANFFRTCQTDADGIEISNQAGAIIRADRKSTRLNSSHEWISYAVFCLKKKRCLST